MARRKVTRQWEVVRGPRGGERIYRLDPIPGGAARTRVKALDAKPGERVLEVGPRSAKVYKVGPRGGRVPEARVSRAAREAAQQLRDGLGTGAELAKARPGSIRQGRLLRRLERERAQAPELVERGLHGPGRDAAGYQAGGAGWGPAKDMAAALGIDPSALVGDVQGFSRLVESQARLLGEDSFKLGNVFEDQDERTLTLEVAGLARRLTADVPLEPMTPYVFQVTVDATTLGGGEATVERANWAWGKDLEGAILAAIVGGLQVQQGWVTSRGALKETALAGEDPDERTIDDLQVRVEVYGV